MDQALYQNLVDSASDLIQSVGPDAHFIYVNETWRRVMGYAANEVAKLTLWDVIHPDLLEKCRASFHRVMSGETVNNVEAVFVTREGESIIVEGNVSCRNEDGKVVATIGIFRDVTLRKKSEEALVASEARYRELAENTPVGVATTDASGNFTFVNGALCRAVGYTREELIGRPFAHFLHPEDRGAVLGLFQGAFNGPQGIRSLEFRALHKQGRIVYMHSAPTILRCGDAISGFSAIMEDVTERQHMAEALRESEEKYRGLVNNVKIGILRSTPGPPGKALEVNPAMETITGYSREELLRMSVDRLYVNPEDREGIVHELRSATETLMRELHWRKKDGTELLVRARMTPVNDASGGLLYLDAIVEDITERRRIVEALRESEEKYRGLVNNVEIGILRSTPGPPGKALEVNPAMETITGYSREELLRMEIDRLYANPGDREGIIRELRSISETVVRELHWRKKGGSEVLVLDRLTPVRDDRGEVIYIDAIIEDITERRRLEEAVRQAKEFAENIINSSVDGILAFDRDFRYTIWNPGMERNTGVKRSEVIGKCAFEVFPLIVESGEDVYFRAALEGKTSVARDRPYIVPQTGHTGFFEGYYSPLYGEGGRIEGGLAVIRNTTIQVQVQRELEATNRRLDAQNEELKLHQEELVAQHQEILEKTGELIKASQLKSQFLANMSHELRTPLNVIIGFTQLLVDGVPGRINSEQRQCLNDILDSSQHLLNLINEVLDLSKMESGKAALNLEDLDLADFLSSVARLMMPILRPRGQILETRVSQTLPPVRADKAKLGQVFRNLLSNASKFSPDGGKILIETSCQDGWCHISVIDHGYGIKVEDRERIFEPFYQLDYTPASGKAGTGLGLSVVKQIVERHGGRVWVEGEYGRGSNFTFTLPLANGQEPAEEAKV